MFHDKICRGCARRISPAEYDLVHEDIYEYIGELLETIETIAEIIHMEMPLSYQDDWLESVMEEGLYKPDTDIITNIED